jgi:nicotinate-nucleotide pyrophosphorylase (carboxylating)
VTPPARVMRSQTIAALEASGLDPAYVERLARVALDEDLGNAGDLTSAATIPDGRVSTADYVARAEGVVAGLPVIAAVLDVHLREAAGFENLIDDGDAVAPGDLLATVTAPTRGLLEAERTSLNLLCHLSGIATLTRRWSDALAGSGTLVRDTRKTTPGLRPLEKYAVRCGGGINHRAGLFDAVLIKDNHVLAAGGVGAALDAVLARYGGRPDLVVQVEIDRLAQLGEALDHGANEILLDNMSMGDMAEAVRLVRTGRPGVRLEASGGITLGDAAKVAATGVDFVAVGALTHSASALDIALDLRAA